MTIVGRILCALGRHDFRSYGGVARYCIRPYCFHSEPVVSSGTLVQHRELQIIAGEELRHGELVHISKEDGKLYKARVGDKIDGAFRIPPSAVIEDGILSIPQKDWPL